MRYEDMQEGMRVTCIGDYADCIHQGKEYQIQQFQDGGFYVVCEVGQHDLRPSLDDNDEFPEFVAQ